MNPTFRKLIRREYNNKWHTDIKLWKIELEVTSTQKKY